MTMKKDTRKITISYSYLETQDKVERIPFIRLRGKWLASFGFTLGQKISVQTSDKKLIITLDEQK